MSELSRRALLGTTTVIAASLVAGAADALPVAAAADPVFAAIAAYDEARGRYKATLAEEGTTESQVDALGAEEARATVHVLCTDPATLAGLAAFCAFAARLAAGESVVDASGLGNWFPGSAIGRPDLPSAEGMFFETLERATRRLLPTT
ncbi:hypothetical protein FHS55_001587 [Angulomicrobium tetraedrale]|uniref:Uncharacterized protein n=1 Tax=Ancylobacter tetraedralis TaxID=217068 RepID=A0A839Z5P6_9HYPH|nr:hypothetical protein [Ancylobacter tetraedralis]MBB3770992.1 hypothetical protein [Ancylobacter tetraedralis]